MTIKQSLENVASDLQIKLDTEDGKLVSVISIPMTEAYKSRFAELQTITNRRFGRLLQAIIKKSIDSVKDI